MIDLDKRQSAIFLFVSKIAKLNSDLVIRNYSFEPDVDTYYDVGYARIPSGGAPVFAFIGLPKNSDQVFVAISDGEPNDIARVIASLQHYNEKKCRLCVGDTVPLANNDAVLRAGWSAVLLAPVALLLEGFPDHAEIGSREYCFHLLVMINDRERKVKIESGFDSLMDLFDAEERDIVTFNQLC